ncbi:Dihydrofolate reductase [Flagellimonas maritima]|uniref:Dihydrofolate reductase n=1 Tax=Flagellimonas maritima TaxID=1383885 RepID=A0A2Z4LTY1_9FLAO|nr:2TM domain-containing protein [Allomuricauda aurantiaca]AWX45202.1 Dihydrofolate reductase [Allomuricauda aurantiaca]
MLSKKKQKNPVDIEQHEFLENAQRRVRQKKKLFSHFVIFLIGSVFLVLTNKILKYGEPYDWSIWIILFWAFLLFVHIFNVFVTHKFMGQYWERQQREKLVSKQKQRIAEIQKEIDTDFPLSQINKKKEL